MPTIVKGSDYMQAVTYTGNGGTNAITGLSFQPDFVWIKGRSGATDHALYDAVRGATKDLVSNSTAAETTQSTGLVSFDSNGFTLGALSKVNTNGATYVAWCWKAGSSTVTNTSGSISSQVRANPTAGVSVVTYTGTFVNATVGHGLGIAPSMIIVKRRDSTGAWPTYHSSLSSPATGTLYLNTTAARVATTGLWNSTLPTSSVFNIGQNTDANASGGTYVAYCFSAIQGYSKDFVYTGNGSANGVFVYLGFLPKLILLKRTDTTGDWYMWDTVRNTFDVVTNTLLANSPAAETSATSIDALSNGFKLRNTTAGFNANGGTYIGFAWATNPFKNSNAF